MSLRPHLRQRRSIRLLVPVAVLAGSALAACSGTTSPVASTSVVASASNASGASGGSVAPTASAGSSTVPAPVLKPAITELKKATTALGEVVVDGNGMTLYMFTKDTQGGAASACAGACLAAWPLVVSDSAPKLTGVTGTVGSIATADGRKQVTLNGWPLYYFAKDKAAGDVAGQGVNQVWYVLDPTGTPVKK